MAIDGRADSEEKSGEREWFGKTKQSPKGELTTGTEVPLMLKIKNRPFIGVKTVGNITRSGTRKESTSTGELMIQVSYKESVNLSSHF